MSSPKQYIEPSPQDAYDIRASIAQGLRAGESEDELYHRREQLRIRFPNITTYQIAALGAHLKISANKAIDELGLNEKLNVRDLLNIYEILSHASTDGEFKVKCAQLASGLHLKYTEIESVFNKYKLIHPDREYIEKQDGASVNPEAQPDALRAESFTRVELRDASLGAQADYDNPVKIAWRQAWYDFIRSRMSDSELRAARVICLPSYDCKREVQGYIDMGIQPKNIVAVERDHKVEDRFRANALQLGIVPEMGDLGEVGARYDRPFNIISADFVGPFCNAYVDQVQQIPLAARALILINLRGGRERAEIKSSMLVHHLIMYQNLIEDLLDNKFDIDISSDPNWIEKIAEAKGLKDQEISQLRESVAGHYLLAVAGSDRVSGLPSSYRDIVAKSSADLYVTALGRITKTIEELLRLSSRSDSDVIGISRNLMDMAAICSMHRLLVTHLEKVCYNSPVNQNHAPYYSFFADAKRDHELYRQLAKPTSFMNRLVAEFIEFEIGRADPSKDTLTFKFVNRHDQVKLARTGILQDDCIILFSSKRGELVRMSINDLILNGVLKYNRWTARQKFISAAQKWQMPRREIII